MYTSGWPARPEVNAIFLPSGLNSGDVLSEPCPPVILLGAPPARLTSIRSVPASSPCEYAIDNPFGENAGVVFKPEVVDGRVRPAPPATSFVTMLQPRLPSTL